MGPRIARSLAIGGACVLLGGCADNHNTTRSAAALVRVTERDFHIAASVKQVPAGAVQFTVHNQGPDDHELIVVRESSRDAPLPLRNDGVTIDEDGLAPVTVGSGLVPGQPGSVRRLGLSLTPGRYVIFCNMAGHFMAGMHTELVVR